MPKKGDIVGEKYELVRLIGEGGMGSVFEARHVEIALGDFRAAVVFIDLDRRGVRVSFRHPALGTRCDTADHDAVDEIKGFKGPVQGLAGVILHRHTFRYDNRITDLDDKFGCCGPDFFCAGVELDIGIATGVHRFGHGPGFAGRGRLRGLGLGRGGCLQPVAQFLLPQHSSMRLKRTFGVVLA